MFPKDRKYINQPTNLKFYFLYKKEKLPSLRPIGKKLGKLIFILKITANKF